MDPTIAKEAAQFGPYAFLVVVILFAVWKLFEKVLAVVDNNTQALTRLCDSSEGTVDSLAQHDQRAQRIEQTVGQISRVVDRTEQKIDSLGGGNRPRPKPD